MSPSLRILQCVLYVSFLVLSATAKPLGNACYRPLYRRSGATPGWYTVILEEPRNSSPRTMEKYLRTVHADESLTVERMRDGYGYSTNMTDVMLEKARSDCNVKFVEMVAADYGSNHATSDRTLRARSTNSQLVRREVQKNAFWGLAQMSASQKLRQEDFRDDETYYVSLNLPLTVGELVERSADHAEQSIDRPGEGVDIYIIDSGITRRSADDDGGKLFPEFANDNGEDRVTDEINVSDSDTWDDDLDSDGRGHGTAVASCIGGRRFGIARYANLRNVKYEKKGAPDLRNLAEALRRITRLHQERRTRPGFKGSIINMSLTVHGANAEITRELKNAHDAGITLVGSSGDYDDGDVVLPCTDPHVICVGATAQDYTPRAAAKGTGAAYQRDKIDIWAPGVDVEMVRERGTVAVGKGTSYATGYVSGVISLFYGDRGPSLSPDRARQLLIAQAQPWVELPKDGAIEDWEGAPRAFVNTGFSLAPSQPFLDRKTCFMEVGVAQESGAGAPTIHIELIDHHGDVVGRWEDEMDDGETAELDVLSYHVEWELSSDPDRPTSGDLEFAYGRWSTWDLSECDLQPELSWSTCDSMQMQYLCRFAC